MDARREEPAGGKQPPAGSLSPLSRLAVDYPAHPRAPPRRWRDDPRFPRFAAGRFGALPPGFLWGMALAASRIALSARLTESSVGKAEATSSAKTAMLVPPRYVLAYLPRIPPDIVSKSYSRSRSFFLLFLFIESSLSSSRLACTDDPNHTFTMRSCSTCLHSPTLAAMGVQNPVTSHPAITTPKCSRKASAYSASPESSRSWRSSRLVTISLSPLSVTRPSGVAREQIRRRVKDDSGEVWL
jgi:hypothetical protein